MSLVLSHCPGHNPILNKGTRSGVGSFHHKVLLQSPQSSCVSHSSKWDPRKGKNIDNSLFYKKIGKKVKQ